LSPNERKRVAVVIIRMLKGDGDPLDGFGTVISSANTSEEAANHFKAGADGVVIDGNLILRDQVDN
jgi:hypothetical protein